MEFALSLFLWILSTPDQLVLELGANSFRQREAAEVQLLRMRGFALQAVKKGRNNENAEIAGRCQSIYPKLYRFTLDDRIGYAFEQDPPTWKTPKGGLELPGIELWKKSLGSGAESEKAYLECLKDHKDLFILLEKDLIALISAVEEFDRAIYKKGYEKMTPSELNLLLLFGTIKIPSEDKLIPTERNLIELFSTLEYEKIAQLVQESETAQTLFTQWAKSAREKNANRSFLDILSLYRVKATAQIALDMAQDAALTPRLRAESLIAFGSIVDEKKHAVQLLKFLEDETQVMKGVPLPGNVRQNGDVQVRDIALGALIRCLKLEPDDFGFEGAFPVGGRIPQLNYYAFPNDATRNAAHAQFQKWRAKNLAP